MIDKLATDNIKQTIAKLGMTQTQVAKHLGVSKEIVSKWLQGRNTPPPNKLLSLGRLLSLSFDDLVIKDDRFTPKVAFRKKKGTRTKDHHIEKAQEMGYFLRKLVPYLTYDLTIMPPVLKSPSRDYEYLRKITTKIRKKLKLAPTDKMDFRNLLSCFAKMQATIVPALWGEKDRHENAIHIVLPDSQTTWVYLNLDTNIHDFKFWMAHELGHCMSPSLEGDAAEDFADSFAGALLFSHELAERAYNDLYALPLIRPRVQKVLDLADEYLISPYTVYKQVESYTRATKKEPIDLGKNFHAKITNFNKRYKNVSESIFSSKKLDSKNRPSAHDYIEIAEKELQTRFFGLLRKHIKKTNVGTGFIQTVLNTSLLDAMSIRSELI